MILSDTRLIALLLNLDKLKSISFHPSNHHDRGLLGGVCNTPESNDGNTHLLNIRWHIKIHHTPINSRGSVEMLYTQTARCWSNKELSKWRKNYSLWDCKICHRKDYIFSKVMYEFYITVKKKTSKKISRYIGTVYQCKIIYVDTIYIGNKMSHRWNLTP